MSGSTHNSQEPLGRALRWVDRALVTVASAALLAMMVHITLDVLASLLFNSPLALTSAYVIQYYMIGVAFLPLFSTEYRGAHISVDMFVNYLPPGLRRAVGMIVLALVAVVYGLLAAQSWQQAMAKLASKAYVMEQTSQVLVWPSFFMLPLGFGLVALLMAVKLALELKGLPATATAAEAEAERGADELNEQAGTAHV